MTLDTLQHEKRDAILQLAGKYGARDIRVFGSVARGESSGSSDVDFLVEFESGRTLFDLIGLRLDLRDLLGTEVDLMTPASLHYLREHVLAEAKPI